jgi:hypothetical protein
LWGRKLDFSRVLLAMSTATC